MPIDFKARMAPEDVDSLFQLVLGRSAALQTRENVSRSSLTVEQYFNALKNSEEFKTKFMTSKKLREITSDELKGFEEFRSPKTLTVDPTAPKTVLLIGSCLMGNWPNVAVGSFPSTKFEKVTVNNVAKLPAIDAKEAESYDFQIIQIPSRTLVHESESFSLKYNDVAGHQQIFDRACKRISQYLANYMTYNKSFGVMTFVLNFPVPQQNWNGRLLDRYALSNPVYFYEELNRHLYREVSTYQNAYVLDFDQITSNFGKKSAMDELVTSTNHGGFLTTIWARPEARLEHPGRIPPEDLAYTSYVRAILEEAVSLKRTIEQADSVKLAVFDLDDTLWNGVAAEMDDVAGIAEGWPMGVMEAVSILWRRGVLVAIVSKNDESVVRDIWKKVYGARFDIGNFVAVKANWRSKAENIGEIMTAVNLLPGSVLFVDDNPVERANVRSAFPEIRTLDVPLLHWRRTLLCAPELQRAAITDEAAARTQMIQAQMKREDERASMGEEEFLADLRTSLKLHVIASCEDKKFERAFELVNKTNQFNTTGRRWSIAEIGAFFADGGELLAIDVADKYTAYGITVILFLKAQAIEQFVMSCRVFGMRIEHAALSLACGRIAARGHDHVVGKVVATEKNRISREIFADCGFEPGAAGEWRSSRAPAFPETVTVEPGEAARLGGSV